jgi:hypothetical protein
LAYHHVISTGIVELARKRAMFPPDRAGQEAKSGPEGAGPGTEGGKSTWTKEDKRNLTISFVGGLAANIGVVLIIGGALAIDRVINRYPAHTRYTIYSYFAGLGIAMLIVLLGGLAIRRATGKSGPLSEPYNIIVWGYVALLGASLLIFLGIAAGIGK